MNYSTKSTHKPTWWMCPHMPSILWALQFMNYTICQTLNIMLWITALKSCREFVELKAWWGHCNKSVDCTIKVTIVSTNWRTLPSAGSVSTGLSPSLLECRLHWGDAAARSAFQTADDSSPVTDRQRERVRAAQTTGPNCLPYSCWTKKFNGM